MWFESERSRSRDGVKELRRHRIALVGIYWMGTAQRSRFDKSKTALASKMLTQLLTRQNAATARFDWILAITFIAYIISAFGNGANDVANAYATSVAARTLTMYQVGFLSVCTEFFGAVALGSRVTSTIKNGIINIDRFEGRPGVLMLAMGCAEIGSATWLMIATGKGMPVSTTQVCEAHA